MSTEQLLMTANQLIEYLRSLDGPDQALGLDAAENIERTLALFATDAKLAAGNLSYDLGGKGMLDWGWSSAHRVRLEAFSSELFALLRSCLPTGRP